jgi:carboxyl-terminal processing protease
MSPRSRLVVALLSTGVVFYIALGSVLGRVLGDTTYGQLALFNEVIRMVMDSYVEPIDLGRTMDGAYRGLTDALDGDSAYLDAEAFASYLAPVDESAADVGLVLTRRFAFLMVVSVRPGSPAARADLRTGDVIKTIDGRHTRPIGAPLGLSLLRGEPGSSVALEILRSGSEPIDVQLVRERIKPAPPQGSRLPGGQGLIRVSELSTRTADEIESEIEALRHQGIPSLVLDLRGTAYGPIETGVDVAGLFMKGGLITKLVGRRVAERQFTADQATAWDGPLAVLIDRGTAGGAEIVAAALQDTARAQVVGEPSFGIAPVQQTFPMPKGGLVLTVAKYLSPSGEPIHERGVTPAVLVTTPSEPVAGEDPILDRALEVLGEPAPTKKAA